MAVGVEAERDLPTSTDTAASYAKGVRLVLTATLFWSMAGLVIRSMEQAAGWQIIFWRGLALGLAIFVMLAMRYGRTLPGVVRDAGWPALAAGVCSSVAGMFFVMALGEITIANTLLMTAMSPFVAAGVAWLLMREPVRRTTLIAMAIAAVGIAVMVQGAIALGFLLGNLYALGSAISFGLFGVTLRRGRAVDMTPAVLAAATVTATVGGSVLLAQGLATGEPFGRFVIPLHDLLLCFFLGAVQQGVGTTCFTRGARFVPAAHLQLFAMSELILGPLWVFLFVGERPMGSTLAGGGLVVSALLFQAWTGIRRAQ